MRKKTRKDFNIDLYGETWSVQYITPIIMEGQRAYGLCDPDIKTLFIDSTLDDMQTAVTFFHELFHGYVRRLGVVNANLSPELEELIADQFATLIAENFTFDF